jgi:hypothetical protein
MPKRKARPSEPRTILAAQEGREPILLPANERGLSPAFVARFDRLKRRLARNDLKPTQRNQALDELDEMVRAPGIAADRAAISEAIAETIALAEGRGETVAPARATGPIRIMSRGGLRQAYEDGHLAPERGTLRSDDLWEAGKRYRDCFEAVEGMTASQKGGGGGFGPKGPQPRILEAGDRLKQMRDALTDRQIAVVDMVCGEDKRLRVAADELRRGFLGAKNSLRGALTILATLKIERRSLAEVIRLKTTAIEVAAKRVA